MTADSPSSGAPIDRVDAALFYDHSARDGQRLSDVIDIAQSDEGAGLLDRVDEKADALYLGAESTFEGVELRGEPARQPTRRLAWEFWSAQGWASLDVDLGSDGAAGDGRRTVFRWTAPSDWQLSDQGGDALAVAPQYWVRARLA